jgi:hypothetical protein
MSSAWETKSHQSSEMQAFELADQASKRIYERLTKKGQDHKAVDYFRELTSSFDGYLNAIPNGSSIHMLSVIALEVYSISRIDELKRRLVRLFDRSPSLDAPTRRGYHRRLDDFANNAKLNAGTHSITHFHDSPIHIKSRLFSSCGFSLELVGGYLVRIYIHFKPADRLLKLLSTIAEEQYPTRLRLKHGLRGFRRVLVSRVDFGNTRKSNALMELDQSIAHNLYTIISKQFHSGIYLDYFKGLPLVHLLTHSDCESNGASSKNPSNSSTTNFYKLLLRPSPDYKQTQYYSDTDTIFVELRSRKKARLESYAKHLTSSENNNFPCFSVLPIFAEKEALWLQACMLCELESAFMRMIHDANISGQRRKRFEIYRLSSIYRIFSRGFNNRIFFKITAPGGPPVAGFGIDIGDDQRVDYCEMGVREIKSARKLIEEHLEPLLQACELAKDEASDSFQRWIQWFIVLLSLLAVPLTQIFWERTFNYHYPAKVPPSRISR